MSATSRPRDAADPVAIATRNQRAAADPRASAWVSASAGSGKTKVLTDRVLTLLLSGAAPQRILCLTFTKAAAAQMANRIAERLARWVNADDDTVANELADLLGRVPDTGDVARARRLFAQVLDAPGGLRIETIHAFCQSLLRRFPLEAGVSPHFELIEERAAQEAMHDARERVFAAAAHDAELAAAMTTVTSLAHENSFDELMTDVAGKRGAIARVLDAHGGLTGAIAATCRHFGVEPGVTRAHVLAQACAKGACDEVGLMRAAKALGKGAKSDIDRSAIIASWVGGDRIGGFADYAAAFLTKDGNIRKTLATKAVADEDPAIADVLAREAERVLAAETRARAADAAAHSGALLVLAHRILAAYAAHKDARAALDYDDLIDLTDRLLKRTDVAAWVLYKLDGGIDHVLIDEAQDTNPDQWSIVNSLTDEFFTGHGRREDASPDLIRTVFAVGDRKQSIFGFQGADPDGFLRTRARFEARVTAADRVFRAVDLHVSFRSVGAVLSSVDAVFALAGARDGVAIGDEPIVHQVARRGQAGQVDLWPPIDPPPGADPPPWKPPVERVNAESAQNRLARLVADYVDELIKRRETLPSKGRPIRPGDVMVLVRRRTPFVDELIRRLKERRVPVAGIDRMKLTEQLAVMDLLALARFLILPEDDLNLACVLKSPLVGLSEDDLFALAHGRGTRTLWSVLEEHGGAESPAGRAHKFLADLLAKADAWTPHGLFAHVLVAGDGRRKLLARLGPDADDPLDEFINLVLAYQRSHPPSLQAFLAWLDQGDVEIKRDLEQGEDGAAPGVVRIMTVHGAKGLQAPIVMLPDTLQAPAVRETLFFAGDDGAPAMIWAAPNTARHDQVQAAHDAAQDRQMQEYRRLLYVAMTRAEDRLIVCGWNTKHRAPDGCWYRLIEAAMTGLAAPVEDPVLAAAGAPFTTTLRLAETQQAAPKVAAAVFATVTTEPMPAWLRGPPPAEPEPPRPLTPSRPGRDDPAVRSPVADDGAARFARGLLIHRLLQTLPDVPPARRRDAALALVRRPAWSIAAEDQAHIVAETLRVLDTPDFAALFAAGSRAEVPITGLVRGQRISGQVDRLAVTADQVLIIDYKTNRPPPRAADQVDPAYVVQMAAYRAALAAIYPRHRVRCLLLWTHGDETGAPFTLELEAAAMDAALDRLIGPDPRFTIPATARP
ncbi:MAG: double-strand break repair helicase AddA [Rhodospirillaceae bacterium]|nr:double-strand break repair helicase AddA [Rhodospirillaceae bacterium]